MKAVAGLKIVFLVAEPVTEDRAEVQRWLETEAEAWGDILQPGLEDGHRKLGYKILAGGGSLDVMSTTILILQAMCGAT